nr:unnamed protein product [Digitaria exilis]
MAPPRLRSPNNKPSQCGPVLWFDHDATNPIAYSPSLLRRKQPVAPHVRATHWRQGRDEPAASQSNQQPCPPAAAAAAGEAR